jgi:LacI family transcriptional regulator
MGANISELASRLNLSKGTVSRILNGKGEGFSEQTRRRVLATAEEIGYRPNHMARALATGKTGLIALWLWTEGLQSAYHARVAHAMHATLMAHPYQLIINPIRGEAADRASQKLLTPWNVDGIVAHEAGPAVEEFKDVLERQRIPIVSTGAFYVRTDMDCVGIDFTTGMEEVARHLMAPGRRRIAYLTYDLPRRAGDPRYEVLTACLRAGGLEPEFIEVAARDRAVARADIKSYIAARGCQEAIFCHNDDLAIGVLRGLRDLGIRVPDDVALVGCDGIEDTEYLDVPLSTIVQPLEEMCRIAWEYLERRMKDPDAALQQTWLQPHLVIRESSRVAADASRAKMRLDQKVS